MERADSASRIEPIWNIAVSVSNGCDETFPIIISANFNPSLLAGRINDDAALPIGRDSGAALSLLDDRAIALVRKDGSHEVIIAKYCTRKTILGASCVGDGSATYLTPNGKTFIRWTGEEEE